MNAKIRRYSWFVLGVVLNSMGIALITKAALGTSPISSLPYVLSFAFPLTLGQFTFLVNLLFIAGQILLLRREFAPIQLLQLVVNVVFSGCIDVSMSLFSWLQPHNALLQLVSLVAGCTVLALGISMEVAPEVLMVPGEGMVSALSHATKLRFGSTKIAFDVTLVATAAVLSLVFFHRLQGLGLGTILSALLVGRLVNLYNRRIPLISSIARLKEAA